MWRLRGAAQICSSIKYNLVYELYLSFRAVESYLGKKNGNQEQIALKKKQWGALRTYKYSPQRS